MNEFDIVSRRARSLVSNDRIEDARAWADETNRFCAFASLHEVAAQLHQEKLPPRLSEVQRAWQEKADDFGSTNGRVSPYTMLEFIAGHSPHLGIALDTVLSQPGITEKLLLRQDLETESEREKRNEGAVYTAHAESRTVWNQTDRRRWESERRGWTTLMVMTFTLDTLPSKPVQFLEPGSSLHVPLPFLEVLVKKIR